MSLQCPINFKRLIQSYCGQVKLQYLSYWTYRYTNNIILIVLKLIIRVMIDVHKTLMVQNPEKLTNNDQFKFAKLVIIWLFSSY